jgi:hypothetical protein
MDQEKDLFDDNLKNKKNQSILFLFNIYFLPSILARSCVRVSGVDLLDMSANNGG